MRFETSSDCSFSNDEPSEGGHCDQRHIGAVLCVERTNISQKFKAIPLRQSDIGQNNIWAVFSDCLQPLESIWTGKDFGSVSREKLRDAKQSVRIIFYDDDRSTAKDCGLGHISTTQNSTKSSVQASSAVLPRSAIAARPIKWVVRGTIARVRSGDAWRISLTIRWFLAVDTPIIPGTPFARIENPVNFCFKWRHRDGSTVEFSPTKGWTSDDPLKTERLSKLNQHSSATPVIPPSVLNWLQEECELIDFRVLGSSSD